MHKAATTVFPALAREELEKCAHCGKCRSVCPVFAVAKDEAFVARGRICLADALVKGEIPASDEIATIMSACLMCRRCSVNCPSGVEFTEILRATRALVALEKGTPPAASFFFRRILPNRSLFDTAVRGAAFTQKLLPGRRSGVLRHLPLLFAGNKWLPHIAKVSALQAHATSSKPNSQMRVGIFVGCLINYVYPGIVDATIQLLEKADIDAVVPSTQVCCGVPVLSFGDIDASRMLALKNVKSFKESGCDCIITACASCGRALKQEYGRLLEDSGAPFGVPVYDVSEFLSRHANMDFARLQNMVTYHDPCHLRWGQGIIDEPRKLLANACRFLDPAGEMTCCGQAGMFHILFPELAESIGRKKLESLASNVAAEVATGCPGCMLQLNSLFAQARIQKRAVHTVEILAASASDNFGKREQFRFSDLRR